MTGAQFEIASLVAYLGEAEGPRCGRDS